MKEFEEFWILSKSCEAISSLYGVPLYIYVYYIYILYFHSYFTKVSNADNSSGGVNMAL